MCESAKTSQLASRLERGGRAGDCVTAQGKSAGSPEARPEVAVRHMCVAALKLPPQRLDELEKQEKLPQDRLQDDTQKTQRF